MEIKVDHREQDPEQSLSSFEQPKPGMYQGVVDDVTVRFTTKGSSKTVRDIELVVKIIDDEDYAGARLWDYPSFSKAAMWKMDQLLLAVGLLSRSKRTYSFKSEADVKKKLKGKRITIRVRGDSYEGEYKAKIAQYMKARDEGDEEEEDEEFEESEESEESEEQGESEYTFEDISGMGIAQLREVADELEMDHAGVKKVALRDAILEELGLEEEDEEEEVDDGNEDWTLEDVNELQIKDLRVLADELEIDHVGLKKTALRNLIVEELGLEEEEEEAPF